MGRRLTADDLRKLARRRLPKVIYDFIEGGADDEQGLAANSDAFRRRPLVPRYLVDVSVRDQSTELFGRRYDSPFGIAPTGGISNYRWGGDLMLAAAAREANVPFIMSGAATASMEDLVRVAPDHGWYQLYTANDRDISRDQIRRAAELGIPVLVITVDVPVTPNRERNRRNGFGLCRLAGRWRKRSMGHRCVAGPLGCHQQRRVARRRGQWRPPDRWKNGEAAKAPSPQPPPR